MDLKDLTPTNDTVDVKLVHPVTFDPLVNDDGSQMTITVYAQHSKEYKKASHEQTNRRLKQAQGRKRIEITAEDIEDMSVEMLAQTTKSWDITFDGKKPKLTIEKAKDIYKEVFWIRDQIEEALSSSLDFTKA